MCGGQGADGGGGQGADQEQVAQLTEDYTTELGYPNTYTLTKSAAEHLLLARHPSL